MDRTSCKFFEFFSFVRSRCLKITEAYILLGPKEFLQTYAGMLYDSLSGMLRDLRAEGIVMVLKVVELVLKVFPVEGATMFGGMLPDMLSAFVHEHEYPMVVSVRLALFCRIILQNQAYFWQMLEGMAAANNTTVSVQVWYDKPIEQQKKILFDSQV